MERVHEMEGQIKHGKFLDFVLMRKDKEENECLGMINDEE